MSSKKVLSDDGERRLPPGVISHQMKSTRGVSLIVCSAMPREMTK